MSWLPDIDTVNNDRHFSLIEKYLKRIIQKSSLNETSFDPWLILEDTNLAIDITNELSAKWELSQLDGLCVLANSGIPLGVLLAQSLGKPLYFYRGDPWNIEDLHRDFHIYPEPPIGSRLCLVDSHVTSGFTATSCKQFLKDRGVLVDCLVTPISFLKEAQSHIPTFKSDFKYISLSDASSHADTIFSLLEVGNFHDVIEKIRNKEASDIPSLEKYKPPIIRSRFQRLGGIIKVILSGRRNTKIKYLDLELKNTLNKVFSSNESDVWNFFTKPELVKMACKIVGQKISINNYTTIVSTGTLGVFFALCLIWHNSFSGQLLSISRASGWNQVEKNISKNECLICSGRVRTGVVLRGVIDFLASENLLSPSRIFALRLASEGVSFPRNLLLYSELEPIQCEILVAS